MKRNLCYMAVATLVLIAWALGASALPVISEIRIDNTGDDSDEYFELSGMPGESLTGLTYLVIGDGAAGSGVVENVTPLTALTIAPDGLLSVQDSDNLTFPAGTCGGYDVVRELNFENSDNVTHLLVSGFSDTLGADLDTNDDGTLDSTPWTAILACVALIETVGSGDLVYCATQVGPDGTFVPGHVFRCGTSFLIGAFSPVCTDDTPGAPNACGNQAPDVFNLVYSPCAPTAAMTVAIKASVTDPDDDVASVTLFHKLSTAMSFTMTPMTTTNDTLYMATVSAQANGSLVQFYVQAADMNGNMTSNPSTAPSFTRSYRVGIMAISAIQGVTTADSCLSSALVNQAVNVRGIVTHRSFEFSDDFFYMQDGTGPNSGIKVFAPDSAFVPDIGWEVVISGFVDEFRCATEVVMFANCATVIDTGNDVNARTLSSLGDVENEVNESMLVTYPAPMTGMYCVADFDTTIVGMLTFVEFLVTAAGDTVWVGDDTFFPDLVAYTPVPSPGLELDALTGIVGARLASATDATTKLRLEPRRDNDVDINYTDVGDEVATVRAYRLGQNRPNPFNPVTTIEFEVARPGTVRLNVFDTSGKLVRRLMSRQYTSPTRDRITWNGLDQHGKRVPSGLYYYELEAEGYSATRKMMILK